MPEAYYNVRDAFDVPGLVTLSRIGLAIIFPFTIDKPGIALTVVALAGTTDMLDGYCARKLGRCTPMGAALDPVVDKIFAASVIISMFVAGRLTLGWATLICMRELLELPLLFALLFAARARIARFARMKANLPGKLATALQFAAMGTALFNLPYLNIWSGLTGLAGTLAAASYWKDFIRALHSDRLA